MNEDLAIALILAFDAHRERGLHMPETTDPVNHPKHYKSHPSGIECIQIVRHMNFNLGNVMKYIWRAGLKDSSPTIQDLEKARWYLDDEITRRRQLLLMEGGSDE